MSAVTPKVAWPGRRPAPLLLWSITLVGITANTLIAPVLPDIVGDFGRPDSSAGLLVAAASVPGVVAAPMIGVAADRLGRRNVVVPCLAIFGLMGAVSSVAPSFWLLIGSRFLLGIGAAGLINLSVVLIGDHWQGNERVTQVGRNAAVLTASLALLPLLSGLLAAAGGWRLSLAPSALALVAAAAAWVLLDDVRPPHGELSLRDQLHVAGSTLRTPAIAATIASGFLIFVMVFGLFLTTLPVHLQREFSLSAAPRGALLAIPSITSTLLALNLARVRRLLGLRLLLVLGAALFGVALLWVGAASTVFGAILGLLVYGLAEGATVPSLQETTAARAPAAQRGVVLAVWVSAVRLGQTTGPLVFAVLFEHIGTSATLMVGSLVCVPIVALHGFTSVGVDPDAPGAHFDS